MLLPYHLLNHRGISSPGARIGRMRRSLRGGGLLQIMKPKLRGLPRVGEATTFSVPGASLPDFPCEARVKTLLRSIAVLDGWLEDNEGRIQDEVRLRRVKRLRAEALRQLDLLPRL
jgi:hypothetical protein